MCTCLGESGAVFVTLFVAFAYTPFVAHARSGLPASAHPSVLLQATTRRRSAFRHKESPWSIYHVLHV